MAKQMSDKEKQRILELYAQGFCRQDIARDLHRAPSSVTKFLAKQETLPEVKPRIEPQRALERDRYYTPACCKGCKHRKYMKGIGQPMTFCSYANDNFDILGTVRGCPVDRCTHYEKGGKTNGTNLFDD